MSATSSVHFGRVYCTVSMKEKHIGMSQQLIWSRPTNATIVVFPWNLIVALDDAEFWNSSLEMSCSPFSLITVFVSCRLGRKSVLTSNGVSYSGPYFFSTILI